MSDTPRTDEATYPAWCMDREKPVVDAAVAYGLERELAQVTKASREGWMKVDLLDAQCERLQEELAAARAELAENEGVINVWRSRTEKAEAELERAMRVVRAVGVYQDKDGDDTRELNLMLQEYVEWEAGR